MLHQGCVYKIGRQCPPGFVGGDLGDVCLPAGGAQALSHNCVADHALKRILLGATKCSISCTYLSRGLVPTTCLHNAGVTVAISFYHAPSAQHQAPCSGARCMQALGTPCRCTSWPKLYV